MPRSELAQARDRRRRGRVRSAAAFWRRQRRPFALQGVAPLVEAAAADARVAGILFEIERLHCGSATATDLRELLLLAKLKRLRVAVYLPSGAGTRELYVASAATDLLGPETDVTALGFAIEAPYLRRALDRAAFTPRCSPRRLQDRRRAAAARADERAAARAARRCCSTPRGTCWSTRWRAVASSRATRSSASSTRALARAGRRRSRHGRRDRVPGRSGEAAGSARQGRRAAVAAGRYLRRRRIRGGARPAADRRGPGARPDRLGGARADAGGLEEVVCEALERAIDDRSVRGVVLHVDSRGGSALASDRMLYAARRLAEKKPLVAFLADSAASGGYMVAVGEHRIVAQPTTVRARSAWSRRGSWSAASGTARRLGRGREARGPRGHARRRASSETASAR